MSRRGRENKETELIAELRSRLAVKTDLKLEENRLNSDGFLRRYLRRNKWNVDEAEKMMDFYLIIITELNEEIRSGRKYPKQVTDMYTPYFGGTDHQNRPVVSVSNLGSVDFHRFLEKSDEETIDSFIHYMLKFGVVLENLIVERNVDTGIVIVDAANIKYMQFLSKKSLNFFLDFAKRAESHSPGLVGKLIVVNAPRILKTLVNLAKKLITFSTEVIIYTDHETDWREKLKEHVPEKGLIPEFGGTLSPWTLD